MIPKLLFATLFLSLWLMSCQKKVGCANPKALNFDPEVEVSNASCTFPNFSLALSYRMDSLPFELNRIYTIDSQKLAIQSVQFYLSNISLVNEDQETIAFEDTYILGDASASTDSIGEAFAETYTELRLDLGVDDQTNQTYSPSSQPTEHPLAAQTPNMYWANAKEYIFLKITGKIDLNGDGIPSDNETFEYAIGTAPLLTSLIFNINQSFDTEQETLELTVDVRSLLDGIDIANNRFTQTSDDFALAQQIANNIPAAIQLK